jgi:U3 small nucleolar RNA-associated protein 6
MSAAADKARFFLEKSVPELKEFERKKIFSKVRSLFMIDATAH